MGASPNSADGEILFYRPAWSVRFYDFSTICRRESMGTRGNERIASGLQNGHLPAATRKSWEALGNVGTLRKHCADFMTNKALNEALGFIPVTGILPGKDNGTACLQRVFSFDHQPPTRKPQVIPVPMFDVPCRRHEPATTVTTAGTRPPPSHRPNRIQDPKRGVSAGSDTKKQVRSGLRPGLTCYFCGAKGTRTPDPHTASVVRYQLRHSPLVGRTRFPSCLMKVTPPARQQPNRLGKGVAGG